MAPTTGRRENPTMPSTDDPITVLLCTDGSDLALTAIREGVTVDQAGFALVAGAGVDARHGPSSRVANAHDSSG